MVVLCSRVLIIHTYFYNTITYFDRSIDFGVHHQPKHSLGDLIRCGHGVSKQTHGPFMYAIIPCIYRILENFITFIQLSHDSVRIGSFVDGPLDNGTPIHP